MRQLDRSSLSIAILPNRVGRAVGAGVSAATAQFLLQPLPVLALGYRSERGYLTSFPTWTSMWWFLSAASLGCAVTLGVLLMGRMSLKAGTTYVVACTAFFVIVNAALSLPYVYGQWWDFLTVSTWLSGAVVIAALVSGAAGWLWRTDSALHADANGQAQLVR